MKYVTLIFFLLFVLLIVSHYTGTSNVILAFFRAVRNSIWQVTDTPSSPLTMKYMPGVNVGGTPWG